MISEVCVLYQQQALLGNCDTLFMTLPHEHIREFHKQWYLLTDCALEIFLNTGKTCLLAFNQTKVSQTQQMKCYHDELTFTVYFYIRQVNGVNGGYTVMLDSVRLCAVYK